MEENAITRLRQLLLIGGSAGSIEVLLRLLPAIRPDLSIPVVIILHRKNTPDSSLAELLATRTSLPVKEVDDKEPIVPGCIFVAPADYHLLFESSGLFALDFSEKVNYSRPSIDVCFESASEVYGKLLTCLLLSGANADGVEGLRIVKQNGGRVAVQNPEQAESPFMPQNAIERIKVDAVLNVENMAAFVNAL